MDWIPEQSCARSGHRMEVLKLAHKLITQDLIDSATLLFYICQPCYTRHCEVARDILSPKHNVLHLLKMSKGEWQTEVQEVADAAFRSHGNLSRFGLLEMQRYLLDEQDKICAEATELALWTMSERSWSLHLTYQSPPIRYAGAMAANPDVRKK